MDLSGLILHETYRLERQLGEGGMGEVYVASHLRLERKFAVKLLVAEAARDEVALGRFQREARVTSALGHPHIVEVVDFNLTPEGRPYLVMELLEGEDLATRIRRDGAMGLARIASIVRQVTSALHAAHEKGVVHRDLKPENVFLCRRGALDDYVKLLDFGISKVLGSKTVETKQRTLLGSPCYMSPEQADERVSEVDVRTDVYSVGTMIFEMLAGAPPFEAASLPSLLYKIVHVAPPDLRALRPDAPAPLVQVVSIAMQKELDLRYPTAEALWIAFCEAVEASLGEVEKTTISHTAWPDHPELPVQGLDAAPVHTPRPPTPEPTIGRSTTLSVSSGELRSAAPRRPLVLVAAGGALLLASLVIFLALYLGDSRPTRTPAVAPRRPDGPVTRAQPQDVGPPPSDLAATRVPTGVASPEVVVSPDAGPSPRVVPRPRLRPATLKVAAARGRKPVLANIYLDGRRVGQSPAVLRRLRPGRHVVEARRYGLSSRKVIEARPGQKMSVVLQLE